MTTDNPFGGEANDPSTFHQIVASNETFQARFDALSSLVISYVKDMGAEITKTECALIPSVRVSVLTGESLENSEFFQREVSRLPGVVAAREREELKAKLAAGDEAANAELKRMRPDQKLTYARQMGLTGENPRPTQSADDEAAEQRMILTLNPAARIEAWRKLQARKNAS